MFVFALMKNDFYDLGSGFINDELNQKSYTVILNELKPLLNVKRCRFEEVCDELMIQRRYHKVEHQ